MVSGLSISHDDPALSFINDDRGGKFILRLSALPNDIRLSIIDGEEVCIHNRHTSKTAKIYKHIGDNNYYVILIQDEVFKKHWDLILLK